MSLTRGIAVACLFVTPLFLPPRAAAQQTNDLRDRARQQMLTQQRARDERALKLMPSLGTRQMNLVMSLRLENGRLVLHTPLQPRPDFIRRRVEIEELGSLASVSYAQYLANNPTARQFEFNLDDYPDAETFSRLHLLWRPEGGPQPGQLTVERTEQSSGTFLRVMYVQTPQQAQLLVFSNQEPFSSRAHNVHLVERDFLTLRQKHAAEMEQWLRPMFRRLHQDAAFAPDANSAWQVLAGDWPIDPKMVERVRGLLPKLGSDESRVRNQAANDLARLGRDAATALLRIDRSRLTLEQQVRVNEVLSRFRHIPEADAARLATDRDFLLDCLYCDEPTVRQLAVDRLGRLIGHPLDIDPRAQPDSRAAAIENVRRTLRPATHPSLGRQ